MGLADWLAGHGGGCGVEFEQRGGGERQRVFVRVAAGGGGIGFAGGAALGHDRVDGRAQPRVASAAVEQQGAIVAEQQVEVGNVAVGDTVSFEQ